MANTIENIAGAGLQLVYSELELNKASYIAFADKEADYAIDEVTAELKKDIPHGGIFGGVIAATVAHALDNLDADAKAQAPTKISELYDYIAEKIKAEADKLIAA